MAQEVEGEEGSTKRKKWIQTLSVLSSDDEDLLGDGSLSVQPSSPCTLGSGPVLALRFPYPMVSDDSDEEEDWTCVSSRTGKVTIKRKFVSSLQENNEFGNENENYKHKKRKKKQSGDKNEKEVRCTVKNKNISSQNRHLKQSPRKLPVSSSENSSSEDDEPKVLKSPPDGNISRDNKEIIGMKRSHNGRKVASRFLDSSSAESCDDAKHSRKQYRRIHVMSSSPSSSETEEPIVCLDKSPVTNKSAVGNCPYNNQTKKMTGHSISESSDEDDGNDSDFLPSKCQLKSFLNEQTFLPTSKNSFKNMLKSNKTTQLNVLSRPNKQATNSDTLSNHQATTSNFSSNQQKCLLGSNRKLKQVNASDNKMKLNKHSQSKTGVSNLNRTAWENIANVQLKPKSSLHLSKIQNLKKKFVSSNVSSVEIYKKIQQREMSMDEQEKPSSSKEPLQLKHFNKPEVKKDSPEVPESSSSQNLKTINSSSKTLDKSKPPQISEVDNTKEDTEQNDLNSRRGNDSIHPKLDINLSLLQNEDDTSLFNRKNRYSHFDKSNNRNQETSIVLNKFNSKTKHDKCIKSQDDEQQNNEKADSKNTKTVTTENASSESSDVLGSILSQMKNNPYMVKRPVKKPGEPTLEMLNWSTDSYALTGQRPNKFYLETQISSNQVPYLKNYENDTQFADNTATKTAEDVTLKPQTSSQISDNITETGDGKASDNNETIKVKLSIPKPTIDSKRLKGSISKPSANLIVPYYSASQNDYVRTSVETENKVYGNTSNHTDLYLSHGNNENSKFYVRQPHNIEEDDRRKLIEGSQVPVTTTNFVYDHNAQNSCNKINSNTDLDTNSDKSNHEKCLLNTDKPKSINSKKDLDKRKVTQSDESNHRRLSSNTNKHKLTHSKTNSDKSKLNQSNGSSHTKCSSNTKKHKLTNSKSDSDKSKLNQSNGSSHTKCSSNTKKRKLTNSKTDSDKRKLIQSDESNNKKCSSNTKEMLPSNRKKNLVVVKKTSNFSNNDLEHTQSNIEMQKDCENKNTNKGSNQTPKGIRIRVGKQEFRLPGKATPLNEFALPQTSLPLASVSKESSLEDKNPSVTSCDKESSVVCVKDNTTLSGEHVLVSDLKNNDNNSSSSSEDSSSSDSSDDDNATQTVAGNSSDSSNSAERSFESKDSPVSPGNKTCEDSVSGIKICSVISLNASQSPSSNSKPEISSILDGPSLDNNVLTEGNNVSSDGSDIIFINSSSDSGIRDSTCILENKEIQSTSTLLRNNIDSSDNSINNSSSFSNVGKIRVRSLKELGVNIDKPLPENALPSINPLPVPQEKIIYQRTDFKTSDSNTSLKMPEHTIKISTTNCNISESPAATKADAPLSSVQKISMRKAQPTKTSSKPTVNPDHSQNKAFLSISTPFILMGRSNVQKQQTPTCTTIPLCNTPVNNTQHSQQLSTNQLTELESTREKTPETNQIPNANTMATQLNPTKNLLASKNTEALFFKLYEELFNEIVCLKIPKLVDDLHLLITYDIMKEERIKKIDQLISSETIATEKRRAEKEFNDMLKIRGNSFVPLFMTIVNKIKKDNLRALLTALYCRIVHHLERIEPSNANYRYKLRHIIKSMLQRHSSVTKKEICYVFDESDASFLTNFVFIEDLLSRYDTYKKNLVDRQEALYVIIQSAVDNDSRTSVVENDRTAINNDVGHSSRAGVESGDAMIDMTLTKEPSRDESSKIPATTVAPAITPPMLQSSNSSQKPVTSQMLLIGNLDQLLFKNLVKSSTSS